MKVHQAVLAVAFLSTSLLADTLPVFTAHPTNQLRAPGATATLMCAATGADSLQWRQNGLDITGATNSTLTITNAQTTNTGYYVAIAKNTTGWTPSQMAYLNVTGGGGLVPFSNYGNSGQYALVRYNNMVNFMVPPVTNGVAQLVAGPEIDQMQPVSGALWDFAEGIDWYGSSFAGTFDDDGFPYSIPTVNPGQTVYYQVSVVVPQQPTWARPSTMLKLVAGGGANPTPSTSNLEFPYYIEWPETSAYNPEQKTNQLRVTGETTTLSFSMFNYGFPSVQWRKNGKEISGATNVSGFGFMTFSGGSSLVLANMQPSDAGVYDMVVFGRNWIVSPRLNISVQSENGAGMFQSPRQSGDQFLSDFVGAAGRNYIVECSTNLVNWTNLVTLTNTTGSLVFSNNMTADGNLFYRSRLLP